MRNFPMILPSSMEKVPPSAFWTSAFARVYCMTFLDEGEGTFDRRRLRRWRSWEHWIRTLIVNSTLTNYNSVVFINLIFIISRTFPWNRICPRTSPNAPSTPTSAPSGAPAARRTHRRTTSMAEETWTSDTCAATLLSTYSPSFSPQIHPEC